PSRNADVDAELRIFNRDGGEVEISGNGTRCAAAWLMQQQGKSELRLATRSGVKTLRLISRTGNQFVLETEMGQPILSPAMIPFHPPSSPPDPILAFELPLSGGT